MSTHPEAIVALDVATLAEARSLVEVLGARADFYKVGLQLYTAEGPRAVEWLRAEGKRVFLDLKLHDIPRTVRRAAESARRLGATLLTVHGLGGEEMVRAAVDGAAEETCVLAVTVLTSLDREAAGRAVGRVLESVQDEVLRLAAVARDAGAGGVVCGGSECALVREAHGERLRRLVPGIRDSGTSGDDQSRVTSAAEATRAGASYVVLGRIVTAAEDPAASLARVVAEMA
jgi:orotidine-5'-phosphate decarboxylase